MMKRKTFISYLMIMLCFIMSSISEIPHHHHNGVVCMNFHNPEANHQHGGSHGRCKSCCPTSINAYSRQEKETVISQSACDETGKSIYSLFAAMPVVSDDDLCRNCFYAEKLHDRHLYDSRGLRSPPHFSV